MESIQGTGYQGLGQFIGASGPGYWIYSKVASITFYSTSALLVVAGLIHAK